MTQRAFLVKDCVAFDSPGVALAGGVKLPDGYYTEDFIPLSDDLELSYSRTGLYCIDESGVLLTDKGDRVDVGKIKCFIGSRYTVFVEKYNFYYYADRGCDLDLQGTIEKWWMKFPFESPWVQTRGKTQLNPKRFNVRLFGDNPGKFVKRAVSEATNVSMRRPREMNELMGKKLHRQLAFIRGKLNTQLSPIGGRITKIVPFWDRGVALCHVWFEINGKDPTRGLGCQVYKNGDFFFGPWCERISQKSPDGPASQLYLFPPKYTLRSWIVGPLYATAVQHHDTNASMPAMFTPTGVKIYAPGTKHEDETDVTGEESASKRQDNIRKLFLTAALEIENDRIRDVGRVILNSPIIHGSGDPIFKYEIQGIPYLHGVKEICLRSDGGGQLKYSVSFTDKGVGTDEDGSRVKMGKHLLCLDISPGGNWGYSGSGYYYLYQHSQIPLHGCSCGRCKDLRRWAESKL